MGKSSLRNVLKNFLEHYEKLEASLGQSRKAIKEYAESGRSTPPPLSLYAQEFLKLKELTESLKNDVNCPMIEGHSEVNRKKNRYKDILPCKYISQHTCCTLFISHCLTIYTFINYLDDNSRVILSEYPGVPGSDYINANYVRGSSGNQRAYIASQGPLPNTLVDFWRMIWETEVLVIVMACNEREAGKYKCEPYWPINTDEKQQYGNITVEHVKWRQVCPDFLVRTFKVTADNEERTICQFHYTTWPDHGVPSSVQPILELVRLMRDVQLTESRPILVHCSAGCGRTGTLCSIDYVWALLRTGKLRENFSLFEIISDMRRQRIAMVQTVEQYMLCYRAVSTLFEQHLKLIDSHTYENIDGDGKPLGIKNLTIPVEIDEEKSVQENESLSSSSSSSISSNSSSSSLSSLTIVDDVKSSNDNHNLTKDSIENDQQKHDDSKSNSKSSNNDSNPTLEDSFKQQQDVDDSQTEEARPAHEKLIGKATVIRRPSIAKLKAIFDNPPQQQAQQCDQNSENQQPSTSSSSSSSSPSSSTNHTTTTTNRLQRSQSIKENFRNFNFNFHLEINQPKLPSRKAKSYTLSAAKLSVNKKNFNFSNLVLNQEKNSASNRAKIQDICFDNVSSPTTDDQDTPENSPIAIESDNIESNSVEVFHQSQQERQSVISESTNTNNSRNPLHQNICYRNNNNRPPSLNESTRNAPPKPPRTYQHILDDSCIIKTPEGRLIVTVAQPIHHHHNRMQSRIEHQHLSSDYEHNNYRGQESIYDQLGARKFSYQSSPNLATMTTAFFPSTTNGVTGQLYNIPSLQHPPPQSLQAPIKSINQYCDNNFVTASNAIYSNPLIAKSFPLAPSAMFHSQIAQQQQQQQQKTSQIHHPMQQTSVIQGPSRLSQDYSHYGNYSPYIDVLNFQQHQAKPIILQQHGYYEPIYGSTTPMQSNHHQYLNQRPSVPPSVQMISSVAQPSLQQQQSAPQHPPLRSKSLTARLNNIQHLPPQESIYGNRKICFNDQRFDPNQIQPIPHQRPKENIYTEIQIKSANNNDVEQTQSVNSNNNTDNNIKPGRFSRLYRAFKLFGLTTSINRTNNNSGSSSTPSSPAKNSPVKSLMAKNLLNLKSKTSTTTLMNVQMNVGDSVTTTAATETTGLKISNGTTGVSINANVPINPINGRFNFSQN